MFTFIGKLFGRRIRKVTIRRKVLHTADGVSMDDIKEGHILMWTDTDGKKITGDVVKRYGMMMVQTTPWRALPLYAVIEKSTLIN